MGKSSWFARPTAGLGSLTLPSFNHTTKARAAAISYNAMDYHVLTTWKLTALTN